MTLSKNDNDITAFGILLNYFVSLLILIVLFGIWYGIITSFTIPNELTGIVSLGILILAGTGSGYITNSFIPVKKVLIPIFIIITVIALLFGYAVFTTSEQATATGGIEVVFLLIVFIVLMAFIVALYIIIIISLAIHALTTKVGYNLRNS